MAWWIPEIRRPIWQNHHNMNYLVMLWIMHGVCSWEVRVTMVIQVFVSANAWLRKSQKTPSCLCRVIPLSCGWKKVGHDSVSLWGDPGLLLCYEVLCWWTYGTTTKRHTTEQCSLQHWHYLLMSRGAHHGNIWYSCVVHVSQQYLSLCSL